MSEKFRFDHDTQKAPEELELEEVLLEANNPSTTSRRLSQILTMVKDEQKRLYLKKEPGDDQRRRRTRIGTLLRRVGEAAACNPNASLETIIAGLSMGFSKAAGNIIIPLYAMDDPGGLYAKLKRGFGIYRFASSPEAPQHLLTMIWQECLRVGDSLTVENLIQNPNCPLEVYSEAQTIMNRFFEIGEMNLQKMAKGVAEGMVTRTAVSKEERIRILSEAAHYVEAVDVASGVITFAEELSVDSEVLEAVTECMRYGIRRGGIDGMKEVFEEMDQYLAYDDAEWEEQFSQLSRADLQESRNQLHVAMMEYREELVHSIGEILNDPWAKVYWNAQIRIGFADDVVLLSANGKNLSVSMDSWKRLKDVIRTQFEEQDEDIESLLTYF